MKPKPEENKGFSLENVKIKLVDHCNLRCQKCNHWKSEREQKRDRIEALSTGEWLDFAHQCITAGVRKVRFSGGEPTLSDSLVELCKVLHQAGVDLAITSNGTPINQRLAADLVGAGMRHFTFSVDGPCAEIHDQSVGVAGAFHKLEAAIRFINQASPETTISVNCVVNAYNIQSLKEMIHWSVRNHIEDIHFLNMQIRHLEDEHTKIKETISRDILRQLISYATSMNIEVGYSGFIKAQGNLIAVMQDFCLQAPCAVACNGITIYPAGDIFVCCHGKNKILRYGNIRKNYLSNLLYTKKAQGIRELCKKPGMSIPECIDCDIHLEERYERWHSETNEKD